MRCRVWPLGLRRTQLCSRKLVSLRNEQDAIDDKNDGNLVCDRRDPVGLQISSDDPGESQLMVGQVRQGLLEALQVRNVLCARVGDLKVVHRAARQG